MAKDRAQYPKQVDGYNLIIWEHEDGTASYGGSFNAQEWDRYLADSGRKAAPTVEVPEEPSAPSEPERPAGNASAEEWEVYARARGASDADLLDDDGEPLGRNALRDKFGEWS